MKKTKLMNRLESDRKWWIACLGMQVGENLFQVQFKIALFSWGSAVGLLGVANVNVVKCCLEKPMFDLNDGHCNHFPQRHVFFFFFGMLCKRL